MSKLPPRSSGTGPGPYEGLSGRLEEFPLADFVQTLASLRKTGKLSLTRFRESGFVFFRAGRIVSAGSTSMQDVLESLLISRRLITERQLEEALAVQRAWEQSHRLGEILVEMNAISSEVLQDLVRQQTQRALSELLRWERGRFEFEPMHIEDLDEFEAELSGLLHTEGISAETALSTALALIEDQNQRPEGSEDNPEPSEQMSSPSVASLRLKDFRTLVDTDPEPVAVIDLATRVLYANEAFARILGRSTEEIRGEEIVNAVHPDDAPDLSEIVREVTMRGIPGEDTMRFREANGSWRKCHLMPSAFVSQDGDRCVVLRGLATAEIEARFDLLTGLLGYEPLVLRVGRILERFRMGRGLAFAVLFIGIDRFTLVNVQYGWTQGNAVLKTVADRLRLNLRPGDIMARVGGDRFCVVLDHLREATDAVRTAERIAEYLSESFLIGNREVSLSVSIGVATSNGGHERAEEMLDAAMAAMAEAKKRPESVVEHAGSKPNPVTPAAAERETAVSEPPGASRVRRGRQFIRSFALAAALMSVVTLALWVTPAVVRDSQVQEVIEPAVQSGAESGPEDGQERSVQFFDAGANSGSRPPASESVGQQGLQQPSPAEAEVLGPVTEAVLPDLATMPLTLELRASEDVWVRVSIDGTRRLETTLSAGQSRTFEGARSAELVIGHAAGATVLWNGNELGSLGRPGQVRRLYFTPTEAGSGSLPPD